MAQSKSWIDKPINSWNDFENECSNLLKSEQKWIFRGQNSIDYGLSTSFIQSMSANTGEFNLKIMNNYENYMIDEFEKTYHIHPGINFENPSKECSTMEQINYRLNLLSVMQHHGAPTRLSDWTHSPYIALFFALDGATTDKDFCVFALDIEEIEYNNVKKFSKGDDYKVSTFDDRGPKFIFGWSPSKKSERIRIQQGLFLVPSVPILPIDRILRNYVGVKEGYLGNKKVLIRYTFNSELLVSDLWEKLIMLNLTHETLYPGLDGFCKSLKLLKFDKRKMNSQI